MSRSTKLNYLTFAIILCCCVVVVYELRHSGDSIQPAPDPFLKFSYSVVSGTDNRVRALHRSTHTGTEQVSKVYAADESVASVKPSP